MAKQPIGEFLATLRKAHGYTQQQVADELGISNRTLSAWEQGRAYPDILTLPALAELYGVTADEIINGERAKNDNTTGVIEELSEKAQEKVYKNKISKFSSLSIMLTLIGSLGAAVFLGATLFTYLTPWLGIVFAVLGAAAGVASCILLGVFYRNTLIACGISIYEVVERQLPFVIAASKSKKRAFEIIGWLWLLCGVLIFLLLITGALLTETAVYLIDIPFAIAIILLIFTYVQYACTVKKFGSETQIKVQKCNGKLLAKCAGFCAIPIIIALILMIVFSNITINTRIYSGSNEDFKSYMHTLIVKDYSCIEAGEYALDIPDEIPTSGYAPIGNGLYARATYDWIVIKDEDNTYLDVQKVNGLNIYHLHKDVYGNVSYNLTAIAPALNDSNGNLVAFNVRYSTQGDRNTHLYNTANYYVTLKDGNYTLVRSVRYNSFLVVYLPCSGAIFISAIVGVAIYFAKRKKI